MKLPAKYGVWYFAKPINLCHVEGAGAPGGRTALIHGKGRALVAAVAGIVLRTPSWRKGCTFTEFALPFVFQL